MSENRIQVPVTKRQGVLCGTWLDFKISITYQLNELKMQEKYCSNIQNMKKLIKKECMMTYLKNGAQCNIGMTEEILNLTIS